MDTASTVRSHAQRLRERARELKGLEMGRIARAICQAVTELARLSGPAAVELRLALQAETGLSPEMLEWGMAHALAAFEHSAMDRLVAQCEGDANLRVVAPELTAVILAGNVFTASLRALVLPLLARSPVLVKTPEGGAALVHAFIDALDSVDEALADHLRVVTFGRGDQAASRALVEGADAVAVYGDDQTMAAVRAMAPATTRVVAHGHGVSAAYVPRRALETTRQLRTVARRLASDVIAYDQLGCLSPQAVCLQAGAVVDAVGFAGALHEALAELGQLLPRGRVPRAAAAQIMQWRGVAIARGTVFQGPEHICTAESGALRGTPGYRHVGVYPCSGVGSLGQSLRPFGRHLKALGVAGSAEERAEVALSLPAGMAPRVCAVGAMQTPPLDAYFDGLPPFAGVLSFIQIS